jgi:hypothetical protein
MQNQGKTGKFVTVVTSLMLIISSLMVLSVEPVNSQSSDSAVELKQVTHEHLTISHYGSSSLVMPLEKGDHIDGNYVVSNIFYYPKWPFVDLKAYVFVEDPNNEKIYDVYSNDSGSFNFTALQSGNYTFFAASNLVDELYWSRYLSTSEINQATPLGLTLNYTITGAPLKISITSPIIQTGSQSNVSLDFSFSRVYTWAGYSLNGGDVVSLCDVNSSVPINGSSAVVASISAHANHGNISLTNLFDGAYTLTLYANDSYGNMASKAVAFIVGASISTSTIPVAASSVPILLIVVIFAVVIGVLVVTLFCRRRRKLKLPIAG